MSSSPVDRSHWLTIFALTLLFVSYNIANAGINHLDIEDNEFAEFEDFDVEDVAEVASEQKNVVHEREDPPSQEPDKEIETADEDEATVEIEDNEFEHNRIKKIQFKSLISYGNMQHKSAV